MNIKQEILNEVKIQDPDTKIWFEKTPNEYKKYYKQFNEKYFDGKLPEVEIKNMNFKEADNPANIGETNLEYDLNNKKIEIKNIKINKDYITTFDEFRNVLVHEMIHVFVDTNKNIPDKLWNLAYNYILECNTKKIEADYEVVKTILGINSLQSHEGQWKEKAEQLNKDFSEFKNELGEKYNCTVDKDSYNEFLEKNKILYNVKTNKIYYYSDLTDNSYKSLMSVIKRGKTKQQEIIGEWYELIIKENKFVKFLMKCKPSTVFQAKDFNSFKYEYIEDMNYINTVFEDKSLTEEYIFMFNSFILNIKE